jgi:hypothetical protein
VHKSFQNGDVVISEATITSAATGARVSILPQVQGIDIFEDMGKPTVYAQLYMFDAINLLTDFPIVGEEDIVISFETPGIGTSVTYRLKVFEVINVIQSDNRQATGYTLRCVSPEHFRNGSVEIKQSYTGQLSDFAYMCVTQYLDTKKKILVEPSKGIKSVVVPKWKPLEAIDYARNNAVSKKYPSSSYVFFETQAGFTFATVEHLIELGRDIGSRVFKFLPSETAVSPASSYRSVLEHENLSRNDALQVMDEGVLFAQTETFDFLKKSTSRTEFRIGDHFQKFSTTDAKAQLPQSAKFVKQYGSTSPERYFHIKDSSRPEEYVEDSLAPRNAYKQLLNGNTTRLLVHGDSGMKAGDMITLELPEVVGTTGRKGLDPLLAGNYIVLRLRHVISTGVKPHHEVALDVAKIGVLR